MEQSSTTATLESGVVHAADGTPILRYEIEQRGGILYVKWLLSAPLEFAKQGFVEVLRLLRETECRALLSDSDQTAGDWSELLPWVLYEFLPVASDNGLRYVADVLPVDPASSFSVYRLHEETRGLLQHAVFNNLDDAREWALQMLRTTAMR